MNWGPYWLLGNLGPHAFRYESAVAGGAAAIAVAGFLVTVALISYYRKWGYLWREWLTSLDHKKIGVMYIVIAAVMLARAVMEANVMRAHIAVATGGSGFLSHEHFAELFSTHGTIMIFFVAMPLLTGLINYVMPLQIGARDMAFPWLNAVSLYLTAAGAAIVMISLVMGKFSTGGWSGYPPFTELAFSPREGPDYWIWAVTLSSVGSTFTGVNFAVTVYKERAEGMHLTRMPLFCWTALTTSILMIFAMVPLTVATLMLALDRYLGFHFFTNAGGGDMMQYVNLFWLFGHPEVYILILPAFGIYSEVISTFSSKRLYGYTALVVATICIAVLSFTVWLHHFFTMGQHAPINAAFGIATMLIGIPTGVKVYDWLLTMWGGRIRFATPMLFAISFLVYFVIGGATGVVLANPPTDFQFHNSLFLVAHFHNMLIPGTLFGMIAGYIFWFPKAFGFRLCEFWGRIAWACWTIGFAAAFMPLYAMGLFGVMRRQARIFDGALAPWSLIAEIGALLILAGLAALVIQLWRSIARREELAAPLGDPWDGRSLEWATPSPPPEYNFPAAMEAHAKDAFWWMKRHGLAYREPAELSEIEMPRHSALAPIIGLLGTTAAFALVWHIWWMAIMSVLGIIASVIARSFQTDILQTVEPAKLREDVDQWLRAVHHADPTPREAEFTPANRGYAQSLAWPREAPS